MIAEGLELGAMVDEMLRDTARTCETSTRDAADKQETVARTRCAGEGDERCSERWKSARRQAGK